MSLIELSAERQARELARCLAAEERYRSHQRRMARVLGAMVLGVLGELLFAGLSFAVTDRNAVLAFQSAMLLCGVGPFFAIVILQLRGED